MIRNKGSSPGLRPVLLIALLCITVSLFSSAMGSYALAPTAESLVVGGSDCSDFMDGFAVGMGVAALLGCVWCAGGAIVAKGIALFC